MASSRVTPSDSFQDAFRALDGAWPASSATAQYGGALQSVVDAVGGLHVGETPFDFAPGAALAFAVVDARGEVRESDERFGELFAGCSNLPSVVSLLRRAAQGPPALGLIELESGDVVAVCAASPLLSRAWPMPVAVRTASLHGGRVWTLMILAPSRSPSTSRWAATAFGLSDLEGRIAVALLQSPTLEIAADRLGVGRETARDALRGAMKKMGVARTTQLVRRLTDSMCGAPSEEGPGAADLRSALEITAAEARVARLTAQGETAAGAAAVLGVTTQTVKSHLRSTFMKTGVGRAKDLSRIDVELRALHRLARADEVVAHSDAAEGGLKMLVASDRRRVAFIDYGPASGRTLFVCHALASGRTLRPNLVAGLQAAGYRPLVVQRPGFGLTDPAAADYLLAVSNDMSSVLDKLRRPDADVFARDIASAAVLAFAETFPDRVGHVVVLNPEAPAHQGGRRYAIPAASRLLQRHPELCAPFFEVLRRQVRSDRLAAMLRASFREGAPSDAAAIDDPDVLDWLVRDIQAMVARSAAGIVAERLVFARGWRPPIKVGGRRWTIAHCSEIGGDDVQRWWTALPNVRFQTVRRGGLLVPITHPQIVVDLLQGSTP